MQFHIPQFIDIEDKIFGPFTFKQFVYVLGAVGAGFIFYQLFGLFIGFILTIPVAVLAFFLGFKPVGGRPFSAVLEGALRYFWGSKLYLWKKEKTKETKVQKTQIQTDTTPTQALPNVVEGKLDSMSWSLDTQTKKEA
ncbi:hypothetical protein CL654_00975 [bacterium]|nr:hypothetical protein [bacterium]|tara:strand:+ start:872 stop:1285 length:414 start_codon:yes stop_codon:yes gene_type:complete